MEKKVFVSNLEVIDLAQGADGAHNENTKSLPKFPSVKTDRETHSYRGRERKRKRNEFVFSFRFGSV